MTMIGPVEIAGGLNTKANIFNMPKGQATVFTDVRASYGKIFHRNNTTLTINNSGFAQRIGSAFMWVDPAQATALSNGCIVAVHAGNKMLTGPWGGDETTQTYTDRTGALILTSGTASNDTWASLNGILVICFGLGSLAPAKLTTYNGNFAALGGAPPTGKYCIAVNNFMFISGVYGAAGTVPRVYWSNVSDPETWTGTNFVDFRKNDGDFITGLASINADLYIFKTNSIGRLSTVTITTSGAVTLGPLVEVSNHIGCTDQSMIDNLPDGTLVFLGTDNRLRRFDGVSFTDLGDQDNPFPSVQPTLSAFANASKPVYNIDGSTGSLKVYGSMNEIWIASKTAYNVSSPDLLYIYNFKDNYWAKGSYNGIDYLAKANPLRPFNASSPSIGVGLSDRVIICDGGSLNLVDYSTGTTGADSNCTVSFSLPGAFWPRFLFLECSVTGSPVLQVFPGYDNNISSTAIYSGTPPTGRLIIAFPARTIQTSGVRPSTVQVKLVFTIASSVANVVEVHSLALTDQALT